MRKAVGIMGAAAAAIGLANGAAGQVWSQPMGTAFTAYSNENAPPGTSRANQVADNFQVDAATPLTGFTWWGQTYESASPFTGLGAANLDSFNVRFHKDVGGVPGVGEGDLLSDLVASLDSPLLMQTPAGPHPTLGGSIIRFDLVLDPPVALPAAGTYWVSVTANLSEGTGPAFAWQRSTDVTANGSAFRTGPAGSWSAGSASANFGLALFSSPAADTDGDGLTDAEEALIGTDPAIADTDGDGLLDGEEVSLGTNPLAADSDGDTVGDGAEGTLGTDPLNADTDGDLLHDGIDPNPTQFDSASGFIASGLLDLAGEVRGLPLGAFQGSTLLGQAVRRAALSSAFGLASLAAAADLNLLAVIELEFAIEATRVWVIDPAAEDSVEAQADFYQTLLIVLAG